MADMLQAGAAWLRDRLQAGAAHDVTYTRPNVGSVTLAATIGQQTYRSIDPDSGRSIVFRNDRDFLVDPTQLVIGGVRVDPVRGDQVVDGGETFEVRPVSGEPCFRQSNAFGTLIRIHTMRKA